MSAASNPRFSGHCHSCGAETEVQTRYETGARALCDSCAARVATAHVVDLDTVRASRGVSGSPQSSPSPQVVLDVVVDVGTSTGDSEHFEALERDAVKFGAKPVAIDLLDGLSAVQRRVAEDLAYVLGVYEVHDGVGIPQPYSQRFGAKRLGVSHMTVGRALRELVAQGVLVDCGETEPHRHYPRGTRLYLPGSAG